MQAIGFLSQFMSLNIYFEVTSESYINGRTSWSDVNLTTFLSGGWDWEIDTYSVSRRSELKLLDGF